MLNWARPIIFILLLVALLEIGYSLFEGAATLDLEKIRVYSLWLFRVSAVWLLISFIPTKSFNMIQNEIEIWWFSYLADDKRVKVLMRTWQTFTIFTVYLLLLSLMIFSDVAAISKYGWDFFTAALMNLFMALLSWALFKMSN